MARAKKQFSPQAQAPVRMSEKKIQKISSDLLAIERQAESLSQELFRLGGKKKEAKRHISSTMTIDPYV